MIAPVKKPRLVKAERSHRTAPAKSASQFAGLCRPETKPPGCTAVNMMICRGCFLADWTRYTLPPGATEEQRAKALERKRLIGLTGLMHSRAYANPKFVEWLVQQGFDPADIEAARAFFTHSRNVAEFQQTLHVANQQLGRK